MSMLSPDIKHRLDTIDPNLSAFFARQLDIIRPKTYDTKLVPLKARQLIPVDNSVPPGAETVTARQYTPIGMAKIISSYATDLPRADVYGQETTIVVRGIGASYGYSIQEMRAAMLAGLALDSKKALAARRLIEETIDTLGATGDSANKITGLINAANITAVTLPNGATGGSKLWSTKTADEILSDMNAVLNAPIETTKGIEVANTLLLPLAKYNVAKTKRMGTASDKTVLQYFLDTNEGVSVAWWDRLKGAGAGPTDRMMAYRMDPDALQLVIPQEFEQFPPQPDGLEFVTPCHARCAGVFVYYPLSVAYADGL